MVNREGKRRLVVGCMTGTSIDGIDAALCEIGGKGLEAEVRFVGGVSGDLGELGGRLRAYAGGVAFTAAETAQIALDLGTIHAELIGRLVGDVKPDLIVLHGQTVFHKPPLSWQIVNPWPVARTFGSEVIFDLRGSDLASGGQGAPITPLADFLIFRSVTEARVVVNFGGFINYTYIPRQQQASDRPSESLSDWLGAVRGGDVSPCNQLLDAISRQTLGKEFDDCGKTALQGKADGDALEALLALWSARIASYRSLGSGDEAFQWIERFKGRLNPEDLLKTACAGIASRLAGELGKYGEFSLVAAGGGVKNRALMIEVEKSLGRSIQLTDDYGIPTQFREAVEIAILGDLAGQGIEITLPHITGRGMMPGQYCRIG